MNSQLTIQNATPDQARAISQLAYRSKAHWGYSNEFMQACRDELKVTAENINSEHQHYFVALRDTSLLGFYAIEQCSEFEYELDALFIEPKEIGMGIGKSLVNHAKSETLKLGGNSLIIQGDPNAEKFYIAIGAKLIGKRESDSIAGRELPLLKIDLNSDKPSTDV